MKKGLLKGVGVVVLLAWPSLGLAFAIDASRETWFSWVTPVALTTEAAIGLAGATLSIAVVQARHRIWQWLMRPFRGDAGA